MQYLIAFCSRLEAATYVISGMFMRQSIADKAVKFGELQLNHFPEIQLQVVGDDIFIVFFHDNFQPEADSDRCGCMEGPPERPQKN